MDPLVKRWRRGHELAAQRSRELARAAEPALVEDVIAPPIVPAGSGPCAPDSERESESPVQQLRRRWARIGTRAKQGRTR